LPLAAALAGQWSIFSPLTSRRLLETELGAGGTRVVVQETDLDAARANALADYLLALVGRVGAGHLEVDLGGVRALCSSCLGKLIALDRRLRAVGGRLRLVGVVAAVYEVFEVTHLVGVLDVQQAA
jgi:anti-anti-sigma factor